MRKHHFILILVIILAALLRLYAVDKYPSGLNADEAAIGYNAYSLLETGKDEHGDSWPIVFKSFGDYKPGGYFYLVLPFVKILGLNILAVRLPSAILGIISVFLIYLLAGEISKLSDLKISRVKFQLFAALILAISPWHIHFSRGGWETNAATAMLLAGVLFFLMSFQRKFMLIISATLFILSMYTYQSTRLISPLLVVALIIIFRNQFWPPTRTLIFSSLFSILLLIPLGLVILNPTGLSRLSGVGLLADSGPIARVNELRGQHVTLNSFSARLLHNKVVAYLFLFGRNYLDHLGGNFLFIKGDVIERSRVPEMGQLYLIEATLLFLGVIYLAKNGGKGVKLIFVWLLIAPLAAAFTFQTPHALRSLNMVVPLTLILSLGVCSFTKFLQKSHKQNLIKTFKLLLIFGYLWCFTHYFDEYYIHYSKTYPSAWEYGFSELAQKLNRYASDYDRIVISDTYDQPYIEILFFLKYPPDQFQKEVILTPRDKFGFSTVRNFGKFEFYPIVWDELKNSPNTLIIGTQSDIPPGVKLIDSIYFPNGQPAFEFAESST